LLCDYDYYDYCLLGPGVGSGAEGRAEVKANIIIKVHKIKRPGSQVFGFAVPVLHRKNPLPADIGR